MSEERPIVIKKVKGGGGHAHHGGAWKVAYADFVTAMMAFFLLMWLINTTTPEQKRGIADYFAPASVSPSTSGSGSILGGTTLGEDGVKGRGSSSVIERLSPEAVTKTSSERQESADPLTGAKTDDDDDASLAAALARREEALFKSAEMSLRQSLQDMPELAELSKHLIVDQTPEGLRIQLVDQDGRPMFAAGAAEPLERATTLLRAVSKVIERLPNRIAISGHTDAGPGVSETYTNWELSADRANASRRILQETGLDPDRIYSVSGKAGSEPLFPDDPFQAANRRISIVLLREAPVLPPDHSL